MEYEIYKSDELTHWGVRGMKWGVRRYQNKDGSLTAAGKKRYNAELAKVREQEKIVKNRESVKGRLDRLKARQDAVADRKKALDEAEGKGKLFGKSKKKTDGNEETTKKSVKDMTDEELGAHIRRIQLEKQYESLIAKPETVKKGNNFVKDFMDKSVTPALQEAGKSLIKDKLIDLGKKKLGLNGDQMDAGLKYIKEKNEEMAAKNKYYANKKLLEKNEAEEAAANEAKKAEKAAAKEAKKAERAAAREAKKAGVNTEKSESLVTDKNTSSGQSHVNKNSDTPVSNLKSPSDAEWQAFKNQYSWGVEPWATDRVDD